MNLHSHILKLLRRLGLSEPESLFYLTAYLHPQSTIATIQKLCRFSPAGAYRIFDSLLAKGFLISSVQNWRRSVQTISLSALANKVAKENLQLRKVELELKKLQHLLHLKTDYSQPLPIEIFTDQNQITEHCYRLLHADWQHITCYGSAEKAYDIPGHDAMQHFVTTRARKGKSISAIFTEIGARTKTLLRNNETQLRNGKLWINPLYQDSMTYIYTQQVTIWQHDSELGNRLVLINDLGLIKNYHAHFDTLWQSIP